VLIVGLVSYFLFLSYCITLGPLFEVFVSEVDVVVRDLIAPGNRMLFTLDKGKEDFLATFFAGKY